MGEGCSMRAGGERASVRVPPRVGVVRAPRLDVARRERDLERFGGRRSLLGIFCEAAEDEILEIVRDRLERPPTRRHDRGVEMMTANLNDGFAAEYSLAGEE